MGVSGGGARALNGVEACLCKGAGGRGDVVSGVPLWAREALEGHRQGSLFLSLWAPGVGTEGGCRVLLGEVPDLRHRWDLGKGFQDSRPHVLLMGGGLPTELGRAGQGRSTGATTTSSLSLWPSVDFGSGVGPRACGLFWNTCCFSF